MNNILMDSRFPVEERLELAIQLLAMKDETISKLTTKLEEVRSEADYIKYADHQMGRY